MIYRSNLTCPDLQPYFEPLICKPRHWSMGHDVLSDPDFEPECGFFTHDEAAILYRCVQSIRGLWVDVGSRTGWTSAHIVSAGAEVVCVDIALRYDNFQRRFDKNMRDFWGGVYSVSHKPFNEYCESGLAQIHASGVVVDGNHDHPWPLKDAQKALLALNAVVIVFHDFWGQPIRTGVEWLMKNGFHCRVYNTPNGLAVCWRGAFVPPDHVADPAIDWSEVRRGRAPEFDFGRCA